MKHGEVGLARVGVLMPVTAGAQPRSSQPRTRQVCSAKISL